MCKVILDVFMNRRTVELWIRQVALPPLVKRCRPVLVPLASLWRRLLFGPTFFAITGSVGKTTVKEVLADILASQGRTFRTLGNQNSGLGVSLNILRVRPWHRFAVIELGIDKPATMHNLARIVRPHFALMLNIMRTHTKNFESLDQYAEEKAVLLESLAAGGLAILNGDDPRVAKMASKRGLHTCLVGASSKFDYWIDQISGRWPEGLRFQIHGGDETCDIQTRHLGVHWAPAMAMALAAAHILGVRLSEAANVLRRTLPYTARLEPIALPNGSVLIRDDYNSSIATLEASLRVLREGVAVRRVLAITDFADSGMRRRLRLKYLASALSEWVDLLVLCGESREYGRRRAIEAGMPEDHVHTFGALEKAADFLKRELRPGDLLLLRGRGTDHVTRLFFAQLGTVACWREPCKKNMLCDTCWELGFQPDAVMNHGPVSLPIHR